MKAHLQNFSIPPTTEDKDLHQWHLKAIQEGIDAAKRGDVLDFNDIKKYWSHYLEDKNH